MLQFHVVLLLLLLLYDVAELYVVGPSVCLSFFFCLTQGCVTCYTKQFAYVCNQQAWPIMANVIVGWLAAAIFLSPSLSLQRLNSFYLSKRTCIKLIIRLMLFMLFLHLLPTFSFGIYVLHLLHTLFLVLLFLPREIVIYVSVVLYSHPI